MEATRLTPTQWRARLPVTPDFAPNVTFSVAYVKDGEYVFENLGLRVARPKIDVLVRTDKPVYAPGDTVRVSVTTRVDGRGVPAVVAVGVVDEMVYVLQPEIAPDVYDFFLRNFADSGGPQAREAFIRNVRGAAARCAR